MFSNFVTYNFYIFVFLNHCESARILIVMPTPAYGHQVVFQPLWQKLILKNHDITLLTTDPIMDLNTTKNFKQIDLSLTYELWHNKHNSSSIIQNFQKNMFKGFSQYMDMMNDVVNQELEHHDVKKIINDESEYFDLVIAEFLHPTMLAFSERFKCPLIGVSPMDMTIIGHESVGNPISPTAFVDFLMPFDYDMTFLERVMNTFYYLGYKWYYDYYFYPRADVTVRKHFGEGYPPLKSIQKNVSCVFVNTHPVFHDVRPLMPNVIQIGGIIHSRNKINSLPKDLEKFLNESDHGVIYFSLGSNVKLSALSQESKKVLFETFIELPYRIVWKVDDSIQVMTHPNIFISKWLPQDLILAHPQVFLFITQGGMQSIIESIQNGVPMIGMPLFADQFANIRRIKKKGICIEINPQTFTKEELKTAILEIVQNKRYSDTVQQLSSTLNDQLTPAVDEAIWWIEYVIKHKGATLFISETRNMPFYKYYLIDIICFVVLILSVIIFIQYAFVLYVIRMLRQHIRGRDRIYKIE